MKKIYIVLTYSGSLLSKIIKLYTRKEYSHVSISLDEDLEHMYSFGRLRAYNPFIAGFVHEYKNKGTFKRFNRTKTKIYSLKVPDDKYDKVKELIISFRDNRDLYTFNMIGIILAAFHCKIKRERSFYCAEFVKYLLEQSEIKEGLPDIIKPEDFSKLEGLDIIYQGSLKEY